MNFLSMNESQTKQHKTGERCTKIAIIDFAFDSSILVNKFMRLVSCSETVPFCIGAPARLLHMLARPYVIVILSDFDFIFSSIQQKKQKKQCFFLLCARLSVASTRLNGVKNVEYAVSADKMHKRFRQPQMMVFALWLCAFLLPLQPEKITIHIFFGSAIVAFLFKWIKIGKIPTSFRPK